MATRGCPGQDSSSRRSGCLPAERLSGFSVPGKRMYRLIRARNTARGSLSTPLTAVADPFISAKRHRKRPDPQQGSKSRGLSFRWGAEKGVYNGKGCEPRPMAGTAALLPETLVDQAGQIILSGQADLILIEKLCRQRRLLIGSRKAFQKVLQYRGQRRGGVGAVDSYRKGSLFLRDS